MAKKRAASKPPAGGTRLSDIEFIRGVEGAATLRDAVTKLGLAKGSIIQRISKLRSKGVPVKTFGRVGGSTDVDGLIAELAKLTGKSVAELKKEGEQLAKKSASRKGGK